MLVIDICIPIGKKIKKINQKQKQKIKTKPGNALVLKAEVPTRF